MINQWSEGPRLLGWALGFIRNYRQSLERGQYIYVTRTSLTVTNRDNKSHYLSLTQKFFVYIASVNSNKDSEVDTISILEVKKTEVLRI